jgi:cytochrome c oxidase cbb3-type subunit III
MSWTSLSNISQAELQLLFIVAFLGVIAVLILILALSLLWFLNIIIAEERQKAGVEAIHKPFFANFWEKLNKRFGTGELVPVSQEKEIMMDHTYDGIYELDNHMPPWLKYVFYITIAFGVVYTLHFLVLNTGPSQLEEYQAELATAEKEAETRQLLTSSSIDESNVTLVSDAAILESAQAIYEQNCAPCHAKDGGGSVGPNLTDEYWLHGGSIQDVFKVIKYGVQEKGMIPWQNKLKPEEIQNVASFVLSLRGTTPENPKEPQGEKYTGEEAVSSLE